MGASEQEREREGRREGERERVRGYFRDILYRPINMHRAAPLAVFDRRLFFLLYDTL